MVLKATAKAEVFISMSIVQEEMLQRAPGPEFTMEIIFSPWRNWVGEFLLG